MEAEDEPAPSLFRKQERPLKDEEIKHRRGTDQVIRIQPQDQQLGEWGGRSQSCH